jgi:hypothetical protein
MPNPPESLNISLFKNEVTPMKTHISIISLFILPFVLFSGCKMGPTKGQTRQALEATFRSFISSIDYLEQQVNVQVNGFYSNAAEFVLENKEGSVVTAVSLFERENELQIWGSSTITNYEDLNSDYIINGELTYSFWYPNHRLDDAYGEVSGSVDLSGGKIESLEFSASGEVNGDEVYETTANNYPVVIKHYDSFFKMLEDVGGKVNG